MAVISRLSLAAAALALSSQVQAGTIQRRDTPGCGTEHDFVGETRQFSVESSGGERFYHVNLPADYDPAVGKPLLIAYHGRGEEPIHFQGLSGLSNPDVNPGMITVFPAGYGLSWEGPSYAESGVSDLQFTTDLLERLKNDFCVDVARIYAAGYSNGGGFVNTLACSAEHAAPFAGFAGVSSALYTDLTGNEGCNPPRSPLPVFQSHGTSDETVPYDGGEGAGGMLPAVPEWVGRWAERNKCSPPEETDLPHDVVDQAFTCDGLPGLQRHVRLSGHSHAYPEGSDPQLFVTPMIVEFLSAQTHPNP